MKEMTARLPQSPARPIGKRKDYGSDHPVRTWPGRFIDAIKRQMASPENREEAVATLGVCAVIAGFILIFWVLLPGAVGDLQDRSAATIVENTGAERP